MPESFLPVAHVSVPQELVVPTALEPDVCAESTLEIVFPVATVLLIRIKPVHGALPIAHVVAPYALEDIPRSVCHFTFAPFHTSLPISLIKTPISIFEDALAMSKSSNPLTIVFNSLFRVGVNSFTFS